MSATSEASGELGHFPENPARLAQSDEGSPMATIQHAEHFTNGHDLEVEESSPRYSHRTSEAEKQSEIERITLWDLIKAEWRTVGMILAPFALSVAAYLIPATKSELATVRIEAASNLDLAKSDIHGQLQAVNTRIDGIQKTLDHTQIGVDELLRRSSPAPRQVDPQPIIAASPPSAPPPPVTRAEAPKPHKVVTKRAPPKPPAQPSFWSNFSH